MGIITAIPADGESQLQRAAPQRRRSAWPIASDPMAIASAASSSEINGLPLTNRT